ncbi:tetratricopeptide repeat protein [Leptospira sp. GIMC2001]|uniref:tetratricopeptide repeat protein n=1 Tax=Leptospira sp. GIMC2001 TaxID=1513297 RepID=UPI00234BE6B5|nr:tetratricopeptide repeat protein [Leptospira sp. GIMC2001]WCL48863.1 tetratricopeptide repeat protein [Leptospira sp. GIMC2001]
MKRLIRIIIVILFFESTQNFAQSYGEELVFAFRKQDRTEAERMVVVGEVVSIEKAEILESSAMTDMNLDTRPDNVVVKVLNSKDLRVGQILYLIEKDPDHRKFRNGNIVGEIKVRSIFDTTFFGRQLRGEGYTRLIENRPMTVVRPLESIQTEDALLTKKRGDSLAERDQIALAMQQYKKSISLDHKLADGHYALGLIHRKEGKDWKVSTLGEYSLAWKYKENFSDLRERISFYHSYLSVLRESIEDPDTNKLRRLDMINRIIEITADSEKLIGKTFETYTYSAWANYKKYLETNDKTRNQFYEKAVSYIALASKYSRDSLFYHATSIEILSEDLRGWTRGKPITNDIATAMNKIRTHGRTYLTINPPGKEVPIQIIDILEIIE